jgi:hypothetical protein
MLSRREVLENTGKAALAATLEPLSAGVSLTAKVDSVFNNLQLNGIVESFVQGSTAAVQNGIRNLLSATGLYNEVQTNEAEILRSLYTRVYGEGVRNGKFIRCRIDQFRVAAITLREQVKQGNRAHIIKTLSEIEYPSFTDEFYNLVKFNGDEEKYFTEGLPKKFFAKFKERKLPFNKEDFIRILDLSDADFEHFMANFGKVQQATQTLLRDIDFQRLEIDSKLDFDSKGLKALFERQQIEVSSYPQKYSFYRVVVHAPVENQKDKDMVIRLTDIVVKALKDNKIEVVSVKKKFAEGSFKVGKDCSKEKFVAWNYVTERVPVMQIDIRVELNSEQQAIMESAKQVWLDKFVKGYYTSQFSNLPVPMFSEGILSEHDTGMKWAKTVLEAREVVKNRQAEVVKA